MLEDNSSINDNQWHHICIVRNGQTNTIGIYVDGNLTTSSTAGTFDASFDIKAPITLGNLSPSTIFDYNGSLDEVSLFNGALDENQVKELYFQGQRAYSIITTPITSANVHTDYTYDVNTSDEANTEFSLTTNSIGMTIDSTNGLITWRPTMIENAQVSVEATNGIQNLIQTFMIKARLTNVLPTNMSHYWKLDEASSPYLDAYSGLDAVCTTNCPTQTTGQVSDAQDFNGTYSLNVANDSSLNWETNDSFTIEFWINPSTLSDLEVAIGRYNKPINAWWIARDADKIWFNLNNGDNIKSITSIDTNQWTQVAAVRDVSHNQIKLYINGVEDINQTDINLTAFSGTSPLTIGGFDDNFYFHGSLDDIAIFNTALTSNEIATHYQNGLNGKGYEPEDTMAPVITLSGANQQQLTVGTPYTELGATAFDDVDGNISGDIVINATDVNTSIEGNYTVTYDINDSSGNSARISRTVEVIVPPVVIVDTDDDNDGLNDDIDVDVNGDGIPDNGTDVDGNGLNDDNDYEWFTYTHDSNKTNITINDTIIRAEGLVPTIIPTQTSIILEHRLNNSDECVAYIEALENGTTTTGYRNCANGNDYTLKEGSSYKIGTTSIMKRDSTSILIETTVKLNIYESLIIGGN